MNQTSMDFPELALPPSLAVTAIDKALFQDTARGWILTWLSKFGPTSGEDIVDSMFAGGVRPPGGDGRKYGAHFQALHQLGMIERYGVAMRRKGNGTLGATIWKITDKGLLA